MAGNSNNRQYQPLPATDGQQAKPGGASSMFDAIFNLSKCIIGAGMMAIPSAYFKIGSIIGTSMLVAVGCLTYFTLSVMITVSAATGAITYSQLTAVTLGGDVKKVLQVAVLAFCFGFGVVYLVIIRDILAGSPPACNGLLCEMIGIDPTSWVANPRVVIAAVALLFCSPLLLFRSMDKLAALNVIGVAAIIMLAAVSASLGVSGLIAGSAYHIPLLPQWEQLGSSTAEQLQALTAVIPVMIACYVAHQSLHPLMPLLQPYSVQRMCGVGAAAIAISFCTFTILSIGSALAFGPDLEVNVLSNYSVSYLEPLVGKTLACVLSWSIRGGYLISLLASLLLYMHPLRGCLAEILWPEGDQDHHEGRCEEQNSIINQHTQVYIPPESTTTAATGGDASNAVMGSTSAAVDGAHDNGTSDGDHSQEKQNVFATAAGAAAAAAAAAQQSPRSSDGPRIGILDSGDDTTAKPSGGSKLRIRTGHEQHNTESNVMWHHTVSQDLRQFSATAAAAAASAGSSYTPRWKQAEQQWYYILTYGLLTAMVLVAVAVPNIWTALSAIGDLASTIQAFVVPGLIAVAMAGWLGGSSSSGKGSAAAAAGRGQRQQSSSKDKDSLVALLEDGSVSVMDAKNDGGDAAAAVTNAQRLQGPYPSLGDSVGAGSSSRDSSSAGARDSSSSGSTVNLHNTTGPCHEPQPHPDVDNVASPGGGVVTETLSGVGGGFVVFLGLALFVNGVYQRL